MCGKNLKDFQEWSILGGVGANAREYRIFVKRLQTAVVRVVGWPCCRVRRCQGLGCKVFAGGAHVWKDVLVVIGFEWMCVKLPHFARVADTLGIFCHCVPIAKETGHHKFGSGGCV